MNKDVWYSFQGCVIAAMPFIVSILLGIATYKFLQRVDTPTFVTTWAALIIAGWVFMLAAILKNKLGE